ncbi:hypothetical protein ACIGFK_04235 [Streptomyces sp. NPDC085524]|uniref:hypothetical protein n=1 Tax=Streptomyces sp. NPDC085524 TaxID=3365728 RepID=UPI0037D52DB7
MLVDTGVTASFRAALKEATTRVRPWSRVLLLTTHGHPDRIASDGLADELGVPAEHYVPAPDLDQMRDPAAPWCGPSTASPEWCRCPRPVRWPTSSCRSSRRCGRSAPRLGPMRSALWSEFVSARWRSPVGPSPTARCACCAARGTAPDT